MANPDARVPNPNEVVPNSHDAFLIAFQEAVTQRGMTILQWQDNGAECRDQAGRTHTLGLQNLWRRCQQHEHDDWPDLINRFLQSVSALDEFEMPDDLNEVGDQLLPRLGRPVTGHALATSVWWKQIDPERLWVNLVIDFPTRMAFVTHELVEGSEQSGEYWLNRALDNLRERTTPEMVSLVNAEMGLYLIATEDSYDAARALILDTLLPQTQQAGCFVAPIGRDQLLVLPVSLESLPRVHILKLFARDHHPTAPYPISDEVFWVWRGQWYLFPIETTGESIIVSPPAEFVEVMNQPGAAGNSEEAED